MKITRTAIENALSSISLPGSGKNLMADNVVKNINIFRDEVVVDVETDNPTLQAKKKTEASILKAIHEQVNEKVKIKVNIFVKVVEKKDVNLIKGNPIEGIHVCGTLIYIHRVNNTIIDPCKYEPIKLALRS